MKKHLLIFILLSLAISFSQECFAAKPVVVPLDPEKAAEAAKIQDPFAATRAYLDAVPIERRQKTKSYARGNYVFTVVDFLFSFHLDDSFDVHWIIGSIQKSGTKNHRHSRTTDCILLGSICNCSDSR